MRLERAPVLFSNPGNCCREKCALQSCRQKGQNMKVCTVECFYSETMETKVPVKEKAEVPETYREIRNFVFAKLINTKKNLELIGHIPNQSVLDLSLVYYIFRDHDPDGEEILVTDEMMRKWQAEPFELFQDAMHNTRNLLGESIRPLREILNEMIRSVCGELSIEELSEEGLPMFVLTNNWKRNGAVCMLFEDSLQEFAEEFESDLFVIPSSIHEVILVPEPAKLCREELNRIIREINRTELREEDILSDHVYLYSRQAGQIVL